MFEAIHKPTGTKVALKKLHSKYPPEQQVARMRREIEIGQLLDSHPHAMPILDSGAGHTWFVMPWAQATAAQRHEQLREPAQLRALVDALASVLATAHEHGWLHRDIKPSNILSFDGRWTLADWGIVRRPRGQTTKVGRTGLYIGTEGFAAPELSVTPHEATASSDIYSIGRVIAWALTGKLPETNLPLLPPPGPWRPVVRMATHQDPQRRPQSVHDLLTLIEREHAAVPEDPFPRAQQLLEAAGTGDQAAADTLLALVGDHPEDYELHVDVLARLDPEHAGAALEREAAQAERLLRALAEHVDGDDTHRVQFGEAALVVIWLQGICAHAAQYRDWDLLEEAAHTMCTWDSAWNQWTAQNKIGPWLRTLADEAAAVIAGVLRDHPESAQHFSHIADIRTADARIRQAVRTSTDTVAVPVRQAVSGAGTGGGLRAAGRAGPARPRAGDASRLPAVGRSGAGPARRRGMGSRPGRSAGPAPRAGRRARLDAVPGARSACGRHRRARLAGDRRRRPACTGHRPARGHRLSRPTRGHGHPVGDPGRLPKRGPRRRIMGHGPPDVRERRVAVAADPPLQPRPRPLRRDRDRRPDTGAARAGGGEPALGRDGHPGDQQAPAYAARTAASAQCGGRGGDDTVQATGRGTARRSLGTGAVQQLAPIPRLHLHDHRTGRQPGCDSLCHAHPAHPDAVHRGRLRGRPDREHLRVGGSS
ncbi:protein kinase [Streptomyces sp. AD2-2]|nr:protein kinase [Streptomyces sp. AD2-2]